MVLLILIRFGGIWIAACPDEQVRAPFLEYICAAPFDPI